MKVWSLFVSGKGQISGAPLWFLLRLQEPRLLGSLGSSITEICPWEAGDTPAIGKAEICPWELGDEVQWGRKC